ncbi:hypothetical protein [Spirosoma telluris]
MKLLIKGLGFGTDAFLDQAMTPMGTSEQVRDSFSTRWGLAGRE